MKKSKASWGGGEKNPHTHRQRIQNKSCSPIVQNLLLRIKHFLIQCPLPPPEDSHPPGVGEIHHESEAILFLKAEQTRREHVSRAVGWAASGGALALSPAGSLRSIPGSAAPLPRGQQYHVQTTEEKSMVPTMKSRIDFTITGTNCSDRSFHFSLRPCRLKLIRGRVAEDWSIFRENAGGSEGSRSSVTTVRRRRMETSCPVPASWGGWEGWVPGSR